MTIHRGATMAANRSWVDAMRAEALATLFLTRYGELDVLPVSRYGQNRGYDLLVRVGRAGRQDTPQFAVETKGFRPQTTGRTRRTPVQIDPDLMANVDLPLVLFVFDVDSETGFYRWLNEPRVTEDGQAVLLAAGQSSSLTNGHRPAGIDWTDLPPLDDLALKELLRRVAEWSGARHDSKAPAPQRSA